MPADTEGFRTVPSYEDIKDLISRDPRFIPFRHLFRHEPLLQFVYHEKCRFPDASSEDRIIYDEATQADVGGDRTNTAMPIDEYHPGVFLPITLTGIWLPVNEGTLFTTLSNIHRCPLIKRQDNGQDVILFLIHPKSLHLYKDLLDHAPGPVQTFSALSLSSFRTVLVAVPNADGDFNPVMVKLSLDVMIQGVSRVLSTRECGLSVANSAVLSQKLASLATDDVRALPLNIIEDPLSYVPAGYQSGMLYRSLPSFLDPQLPNEQGLYAIPLIALYGVKNRDLLQTLVKAHGGTVTECLTQCILNPFARVFIELLYHHQTSIEAHGQNLMLVLDHSSHIVSLLYRDMGGVNQLFTELEFANLPSNLQNPDFYYFKQHVVDAAKALEDHFVRRGLYPLTKQLVKCSDVQHDDAALQQWHEQCRINGFLHNWTTDDVDKDAHQTRLLAREFYRYGYVEYLFATCFIDYLRKNSLVDEEGCQQMESHFFDPEQRPDGSLVAPCSNIPFFSSSITQLLAKQAKTNEPSMDSSMKTGLF